MGSLLDAARRPDGSVDHDLYRQLVARQKVTRNAEETIATTRYAPKSFQVGVDGNNAMDIAENLYGDARYAGYVYAALGLAQGSIITPGMKGTIYGAPSSNPYLSPNAVGGTPAAVGNQTAQTQNTATTTGSVTGGNQYATQSPYEAKIDSKTLENSLTSLPSNPTQQPNYWTDLANTFQPDNWQYKEYAGGLTTSAPVSGATQVPQAVIPPPTAMGNGYTVPVNTNHQASIDAMKPIADALSYFAPPQQPTTYTSMSDIANNPSVSSGSVGQSSAGQLADAARYTAMAMDMAIQTGDRSYLPDEMSTEMAITLSGSYGETPEQLLEKLGYVEEAPGYYKRYDEVVTTGGAVPYMTRAYSPSRARSGRSGGRSQNSGAYGSSYGSSGYTGTGLTNWSINFNG